MTVSKRRGAVEVPALPLSATGFDDEPSLLSEWVYRGSDRWRAHGRQ